MSTLLESPVRRRKPANVSASESTMTKLSVQLMKQTAAVTAALEAADPLGPTLDFMHAVWSLNHALEVTSKMMESEVGLTVQQRMIVRFVGLYPGLTAGRMAELLRVHKATVSTALKRLERRRILKRARDPQDQRRVTLNLTAKGRALDIPMSGTVESAAAYLLCQSSDRDLRAAQRVMLALVSALEERR